MLDRPPFHMLPGSSPLVDEQLIIIGGVHLHDCCYFYLFQRLYRTSRCGMVLLACVFVGKMAWHVRGTAFWCVVRCDMLYAYRSKFMDLIASVSAL